MSAAAPSEPLEIVVVGAGAVGASYALALKRGGARLTFLVRPKYVDAVRAGISVHLLSRFGTRTEVLRADDVVTDAEALRGRRVDQVWLCVPSTSLGEDFVRSVAAATGDATLVNMSSDVDGVLERAVGTDRVVIGLIPLIAYQAPLPGERLSPGIALYLPPLTATPFSGPRAAACAGALKRGRMPARVVKDTRRVRLLGTATMQPFIATLELAGWSWPAARRALDGSAREAVRAMAKEAGGGPGLAGLIAHPLVLKLAAVVAPWVVPLPLETYVQFHFTKVAQQTRALMRGFVDVAAKHGVSVPHLEALERRLRAQQAGVLR